MKIRYFIVDPCGQLIRAAQAAVRGLWDGSRCAEALGAPAGNELRLVSVACTGELLPQRVYLLRLPLVEGVFTAESRLTLHTFSRPDCVTPGNWPATTPKDGPPTSFGSWPLPSTCRWGTWRCRSGSVAPCSWPPHCG